MPLPSIYRGVPEAQRTPVMRADIESRASLENPATPLTGRELIRAFGEIETSSGIIISPEAGLSHPDVFACVKVITEYIAMLAIQIYQRIPDHNGDMLGKKPDPTHPVWPLLFELPNPEMTAVEVIEAMVGHVLLRGNAYAHVVRNNAGQVIELWPLRPDRVWVYRKLGEMAESRPGGDLEYIYTPYAGTPVFLGADEVWHVKGLSPDGLLGYAPIQLQAEAMGGAIASEKYAGRFFANDARPGGVLTHPGSLSDKAWNRLQESWSTGHQGFTNAHKLAILEEGMGWQQVGLSPDDAQFLQTRQFNTEQISRIFRVSGRLLNDERHPSRLSAEDATAEDVRNMVMPWTRRFELSIKRDILNLKADKNHFARFMVDELMRASLAVRTTYYASGRQNGWLSANDVLRHEGQNTIGPQGDLYMVPINMEPASDIGKEPAEPDATDPKAPPTTAKGPASLDPSKGSDNNSDAQVAETRKAELRTSSVAQRKRLRAAYAPLFADAVTRILKREAKDVMAAARKAFKQRSSGADFNTWLENFYNGPDEHRAFIREAMSGPVSSYVRAISGAAAEEIGSDVPDLTKFAASYTDAYAARHAAFSRADITAALAKSGSARSKRDDGTEDDGDTTDEERLAALDALFITMAANRPTEVGAYESVRGDGAVTRQTYDAGGVTTLSWVGGDCAFCSQFAGRSITIQSNFVEPGQSVHSGDASVTDLNVSGSIGHPPLHRGCECSVEAG